MIDELKEKETAALRPPSQPDREAERQKIETYFKRNESDLRMQLEAYNRQKKLGKSYKMPWFKIAQFSLVEIIREDDKKAFVKIAFTLGGADVYSGARQYIYEAIVR